MLRDERKTPVPALARAAHYEGGICSAILEKMFGKKALVDPGHHRA